jgi:hypothetical protein
VAILIVASMTTIEGLNAKMAIVDAEPTWVQEIAQSALDDTRRIKRASFSPAIAA